MAHAKTGLKTQTIFSKTAGIVMRARKIVAALFAHSGNVLLRRFSSLKFRCDRITRYENKSLHRRHPESGGIH